MVSLTERRQFQVMNLGVFVGVAEDEQRPAEETEVPTRDVRTAFVFCSFLVRHVRLLKEKLVCPHVAAGALQRTRALPNFRPKERVNLWRNEPEPSMELPLSVRAA